MIAVLFRLVAMFLIVLVKVFVWIMTCVNVIKSGLVRTVLHTLVQLWTIAQVFELLLSNLLLFNFISMLILQLCRAIFLKHIISLQILV